MTAPCGIVCEECAIYKAASDREAAEALAQEWRDGGRKDAKADWFTCQGCHGPAELVWSGDCKIRQCCLVERRLDNCSDCGDFPCERIIEFENDGYDHHRAAVANLCRMAGASAVRRD